MCLSLFFTLFTFWLCVSFLCVLCSKQFSGVCIFVLVLLCSVNATSEEFCAFNNHLNLGQSDTATGDLISLSHKQQQQSDSVYSLWAHRPKNHLFRTFLSLFHSIVCVKLVAQSHTKKNINITRRSEPKENRLNVQGAQFSSAQQMHWHR